MSYTLTNAEERAKKNAMSFALPSTRERGSLRVGDWAMLIFGDRERMWVEVVVADSGGSGSTRYAGKLVSEPATPCGVSFGDRVDFGPEHVVDFRVG